MTRHACRNRRPQQCCERKHSRGFTLLELLVAVVIMTLMMTVAFGAVRLAGSSWEAGIRRAGTNAEVRLVADFLRRQFAQLLTSASIADDTRLIAFTGNAEIIRFIGSAPHHPGVAGLMVYRLDAEPYAEGQRLVLSYATFDPGTEDPFDVLSYRRLILAERCEAITFEFFGTRVADAAPSWHPDWHDHEKRLPDLVRIKLLAASDADRWPELILPIRAQQGSS